MTATSPLIEMIDQSSVGASFVDHWKYPAIIESTSFIMSMAWQLLQWPSMNSGLFELRSYAVRIKLSVHGVSLWRLTLMRLGCRLNKNVWLEQQDEGSVTDICNAWSDTKKPQCFDVPKGKARGRINGRGRPCWKRVVPGWLSEIGM